MGLPSARQPQPEAPRPDLLPRRCFPARGAWRQSSTLGCRYDHYQQPLNLLEQRLAELFGARAELPQWLFTKEWVVLSNHRMFVSEPFFRMANLLLRNVNLLGCSAIGLASLAITLPISLPKRLRGLRGWPVTKE